MVIQHNISALNSHRFMGLNNKGVSGNLEKLSSGYKVNRAADDAAGLAISEKMRGQIRGLAMAEQNASQGINLIQTAEGGLNETHSILQRMRELAVQASNGTYQEEDRMQIEHEIVALIDEVDRISSSIHYNGINLIDGTFGSVKVNDANSGFSNEDVLGLDLNSLVLTKDGQDLLTGVRDLNTRITVTEMKGIDPITGLETSQNVVSLNIGDKTYVGELAMEMASGFKGLDANSGLADAAAANALNAQINEILGRNVLADGTSLTYATPPAGANVVALSGADLLREVTTALTEALKPYGSTEGITLGGTAAAADIQKFMAEFTENNNLSDTTMTDVVAAVNAITGMTAVTYTAATGTWGGGGIAADAFGAPIQVAAINDVLKSFGVEEKVSGIAAAGIKTSLEAALAGKTFTTEKATALKAALDNLHLGVTGPTVIAATDASPTGHGTAIMTALNGETITASQAAAIQQVLTDAGVGGAAKFEYSVDIEGAGVTFRDNDGTAIATVNYSGTAADLEAGVISGLATIDAKGEGLALEIGTAKVARRDDVSSSLIFQIGANGGQDQRAALSVLNMSAGALGYVDAYGQSWTIRDLGNTENNGTNVSESNCGVSAYTRAGANAAVDVIDSALNQVSSQRAKLGALQNRLESTMNSLGVSKENLTAAESTIRDTDMAAEMMEFTKNNILVQAAQAMLAQANQLPQGVLQLLR